MNDDQFDDLIQSVARALGPIAVPASETARAEQVSSHQAAELMNRPCSNPDCQSEMPAAFVATSNHEILLCLQCHAELDYNPFNKLLSARNHGREPFMSTSQITTYGVKSLLVIPT